MRWQMHAQACNLPLLALWLASAVLLVAARSASLGDAAVALEEGAAIADLVTPYGYPLEEHEVTSEDGFILRLHRIPHGADPDAAADAAFTTRTTSHADNVEHAARRNLRMALGSSAASIGAATSRSQEQVRGDEEEGRKVVLLHHGLLDSAAGFLLLGPGKALALLLADAGYDVWLTNARGNKYSRSHAHLNINTPEFWAFSFDEIAKYDIVAQLDYIRQVTGQERAAYVGFSQGATVALAALADQPELADRLTAAVLLAPVTFLRHASSPPLTMLSKLDTQHVMQMLGDKEFLPSQALVQIMGGALCLLQPHLCLNILAAIGGFNDKAINATKLPLFLKYTPSGTSVQNVAHWAQIMRAKASASRPTLSHFDWGNDCVKPRRGATTPMCNRLKYGTQSVPPYSLDRVSAPLMIVTGGQDRLADPQDVADLRHALTPGTIHREVHVPSYQHLDFVWADSAATQVYDHVLDFLGEL